MPDLAPIVATLLANTKDFTASFDAAQAKVQSFAAESAVAGDAAGAGLAEGVTGGAKKIEGEVEKSGHSTGTKFLGGIHAALAKISSFTGIPLGPLQEGLHKAHQTAHELTGETETLSQKMAGLGKIATLGVAAGFVAASAEGFNLVRQMQSSSAAIAVAADTSTAAAEKISQGFLSTAGTSEFSAEEMSAAFAKVAGQLKSAEGAALNRKQATEFMSASDDLATAKQISLGEATKAVAGAMQAYHTPTKEAAALTDVLLNVSNATGSSIQSTAGQLEKIKTRLGALTPPLSDVGGLLLDLTNHGITGRQAMTVLTSGFQNFLKPTEQVVKAHRDLSIAQADLPASLRSIAAEYLKGNITSTAVSKVTKGLTIDQTTLWGAFKKAADATHTAYQAQEKLGITTVDARGKLLPMSRILGELHDKVQGLGDAQAIATLKAMGFGSNAAKLLPIVKAGSAEFTRNADAATKAGAAHAAAEKQAQTLSVQFKIMKAAAEDLLTKLGDALIPVVTAVMKAFAKFIEYLLTHKAVLIGVGVVVGTVLVAAIGAYIASLYVAGKQSLKTFAEMAAEDAAWAAETMSHILFTVAGWGIYIASQVAAAAAATAAFIAENAATLGIVAGIALLVGAIIWMATHWKEVWGFVKRMAEDAWHFLDGIWHAIVDGVREAFDWIKSHLSTIIPIIIGIITGPIGLLVVLIVKHWKQIKKDAIIVWNDILSFLKAIPGEIIGFFTGALSWLEKIGVDILTGLWNGIVAGAQAVWFFYVQLPIKILGYVATAGRWLLKTGVHLLEGLWHGIENGAEAVWSFFRGLPSVIWGWVKDAGKWLLDAGKNIIEGLVKGITGAAHFVWDAVKNVAHHIMGVFSSVLSIFSPSKVFQEYGKNLMEGLGKGVKDNKELASGELRQLNLGKELVTDFKDISKSAGTMGGALRFAADEMIALSRSGVGAKASFAPVTDAIMTIGAALSKAGGMKMGSTFGKDLQALGDVATHLAPGSVSKGIEAISRGMQFISNVNLSPALKRSAEALSKFATETKPSDKAIATLRDSWSKAQNEFSTGARTMQKISDALTKSSDKAHTLARSLSSIEDHLKTMGASVHSAAEALGTKLHDALQSDHKWAIAMQPEMKKLSDSIHDSGSTVQKATDHWTDWTTALRKSKDDVGDLNGRIVNFGGNLNNIATALSKVRTMFAALSTTIVSVFSNSDSWLISAGQNIVQGLINGIDSQMGALKSSITSVQAASLIGGSPARLQPQFVGGGSGQTTILQVTTPIQINGQTLAQTVTQYQLRGARSTGTVLGQYSGGSQTGAATGINTNAISR